MRAQHAANARAFAAQLERFAVINLLTWDSDFYIHGEQPSQESLPVPHFTFEQLEDLPDHELERFLNAPQATTCNTTLRIYLRHGVVPERKPVFDAEPFQLRVKLPFLGERFFNLSPKRGTARKLVDALLQKLLGNSHASRWIVPGRQLWAQVRVVCFLNEGQNAYKLDCTQSWGPQLASVGNFAEITATIDRALSRILQEMPAMDADALELQQVS